MTMGTWHADAATLERYAAGAIDEVTADSLESHLVACDTCRRTLAASADPASLERMWAEVVDELDVPRVGIVERALLAVGVRDHVARLLAATPSLRLSWLVAEAITLGTAAALASATRGRAADAGLALFLVLAALLPVVGVAVAFGPGVDPTYEIGLASPMRSFRLVVVRALAVLGTSMGIAGIAALAQELGGGAGLGWAAAAWLLPSLALTAVTLALSTSFRPQIAAAATAAIWLAIAGTAAVLTADRLVAFRGTAQLAFAVVLVISGAVLVQRRRAFEGGVVA